MNGKNVCLYTVYLYTVLLHYTIVLVTFIQSLVENNGVEPLTFPMKIGTLQHQSAESSLVENNGVEPLTSCVQGRRSSQLS